MRCSRRTWSMMSSRAVSACRSVHELHRRAASGELERVQRGAVTAADHDDVEPGELVRARLDLVRDVAAERTVRRRGQLLDAQCRWR